MVKERNISRLDQSNAYACTPHLLPKRRKLVDGVLNNKEANSFCKKIGKFLVI